MTDLFAANGLTFERIAATDGASLSADTIARVTVARPDYRGLTVSEIGCFLSHRAAWRQVAAGRDAFAAIFEDDILFCRNGSAWLARADWIPKRTGLVKLEAYDQPVLIGRKTVPTPSPHAMSRLWSTHWGSAGYIISRRFAERLLAATERFSVTVDDALFNPRYRAARTVTYQLVPAVCVQRQFLSRQKLTGPYASTISSLPPGAELETPRRSKLKREVQRVVTQLTDLYRRPMLVRVPFDADTTAV